jgi:parallel beta-helix repeat protein
MTRAARAFFLIGGLAMLAVTVPARAARIDVGSDQAVRTPAAVPWASLRPGDEVVIHAGTYRDPLVIAVQGTAAAPILVRGEGRVEIDNSVVLEGAGYVTVSNLAIRGAKYPGFILRHGAHDDTISDSSVADSGLGIWIGDGAGGGHRILNNDVHDNQTHGIAVDVINLPVGQETLISGNTVSRNVMHGIEVNGSRYIVEKNIVRDNGTGLSGTSGIHLFAKNADQGTGQYNVIRYNIAFGQKETTGQDGNGIEVDQWCDHNQVYFNVALDNDGAGIVLFDAADNLVANNTLMGNMRDSGGRHAYKADLVVASDYTKKVDHAFGNTIANNLIYTTQPQARPIYVDRDAAARMKMLANNILYRDPASGPLFFWAGTSGTDVAAWNKLKPGAPDLAADPRLSNVAGAVTDAAAWRGLVPAAGSPAIAAGIDVGVKAPHDAAGTPIAIAPIGALVPGSAK